MLIFEQYPKLLAAGEFSRYVADLGITPVIVDIIFIKNAKVFISVIKIVKN